MKHLVAVVFIFILSACSMSEVIVSGKKHGGSHAKMQTQTTQNYEKQTTDEIFKLDLSWQNIASGVTVVVIAVMTFL